MANCTVRRAAPHRRRTFFTALNGSEYVPRTADYFPVSMKHLSPLVRKKAIEIANAFLDDDMDEGKAIRIAVAKGMGRAAERETG